MYSSSSMTFVFYIFALGCFEADSRICIFRGKQIPTNRRPFKLQTLLNTVIKFLKVVTMHSHSRKAKTSAAKN